MSRMVRILTVAAIWTIGTLAVSAFSTSGTAMASERVATDNCCVILGVDRGRGTALAVEEKTGRKVVFSVQNHHYLQALRQGVRVGIDFDRREVVLASVCQETNCTIVTISDEQPELDIASLQAGRP